MNSQAHTLILRRVASAAVRDARAAWKRAHASPSERLVRIAFRTCVFAARALRRLAGEGDVTDDESGQAIAEARRLEAESERLKTQLVRIVEG